MRRWTWWFLWVPQAWLLGGLWRDAGLPPIDVGAVACLFLGFFAERAAVPWLLLGCALGRAMVDEASLPVQILVLGVPVAVLLPLRTLFHGHRWGSQALAAAACAVVIPKLAGLCGDWFDQPSAAASLHGPTVLWSALLLPPLLALARTVPPCRAFDEVR